MNNPKYGGDYVSPSMKFIVVAPRHVLCQSIRTVDPGKTESIYFEEDEI